MFDLIVIGGGAAGVFGALAAKENHPDAKVLLLEKTKYSLAKVRISGGGRCNVTHHCFDPVLLTKNYPRGSKELIGPFQRFNPSHTIKWFESKNVPLKTEKDGRMFPVTDQSETIIHCLLSEAQKRKVEISYRKQIFAIVKNEKGFEIHLKDEPPLLCQKILLATGSAEEGHLFAKELGHTIQPLVPSLFTFNVPTSPLKDLSGIAVEKARLTIVGAKLAQEGPLLITHFGFSGPAVLKLSAWGARFFYEKNYKATLVIDWIYPLSQEKSWRMLSDLKTHFPQKKLSSENLFNLPKNLWKFFLEKTEALFTKRLGDISLKVLRELVHTLHADRYQIEGKTTHKEEFVTCGGVTLKEVDFKTMQSKICPGLYFAGEILDVDGITGGFNFQNAWTTGYIAGISSMDPLLHSLSKSIT